MIKLANVDEEVQTHDSDIVNLDETMTTLQESMSDLEDIVDSVEDEVTALNVENDEMQQRLTVLEENVIGVLASFLKWTFKFSGSMILSLHKKIHIFWQQPCLRHLFCDQYFWLLSFDIVVDLGGAGGAPPKARNFLNFMYIFGKFGNFVCWRPPDGWRPLLQGILDPPLYLDLFIGCL